MCLLLPSWGQTRRPFSSVIQPGYLLFPINPGQAGSLSGGMGDLRGNHFHAGLDIRTGGVEGLPVHAAADGYVSRIAVFTGGYGNVLFLKHPNGLTTVYGHLKVLNDTLGRYLRKAQYAKQTFEIDLPLTPNQFPVAKGDIIALSGNTGGSGGPHLHFEVRDSQDNLLNPLLYAFPELSDDVPPYFERIAIRTLSPTSRLNGEFQRQTFAPTRRPDGSYTISQPISASGLLGLELLAYDKANGSPYRNGLNCVEIRLDGAEVFAYSMNSFPHEQTRFINVHMNYEAEQLSGQRYHRGYVADGNLLTLYHTNAYRGKLLLTDGKPHEVTITLFDSYEHAAVLRFTLLPETTPTVPTAVPTEPDNAATITAPDVAGVPSATVTPDDNVLKLAIRGLPSTPPNAILFTGKKTTELPVAYVRGGRAVYLLDLNKTLPDSVQVGRGRVPLNFRQRVLPGRTETVDAGAVSLRFNPASLFDTLYLATRVSPTNGLEINQNTIPLNDYVDVRFTPPYPAGIDTMRTKMYALNNGRETFLGGRWTKNRIEFRTRVLGKFGLLTDVTPPAIRVLSATPNGISARISDERSGIDKFRAFVNGEWVLMQYDYKRALIWSDKLDPTALFEPGQEVKIQVRDQAGNVAEVITTIAAPPAPRPARSSARKRR
ncbi:M23 family metallopeptidase [Fibrella rubiginis]|uniref:M23 family metallopeptidase n=1 Tax=Fibrella rubiginis TaxID=2817060 RepID=UPI00286DBDEC|nr:M23 family metallopeptidase [Fibrella rubiginis]